MSAPKHEDFLPYRLTGAPVPHRTAIPQDSILHWGILAHREGRGSAYCLPFIPEHSLLKASSIPCRNHDGKWFGHLDKRPVGQAKEGLKLGSGPQQPVVPNKGRMWMGSH